jgi:hypothetical protein
MYKCIAKQVISINGKESPCDCDEKTVCAYCVQANMIIMENRNVMENDVMKLSIMLIQKNGIRKTARQIDEHEKTLRRWIYKGNIPQRVVDKIVTLRT